MIKLKQIQKLKKNLMENNMKYTVKWIINGEITIKAENKQKWYMHTQE